MDTAQSTALTVTERASLALGSSKHEAKLIDLSKQSLAIVEINTPASYRELHAARMALKTERVQLEKEGKSARDDATKFSKAVIVEQARLIAIIEPEENRLGAIQGEYDTRVAVEKAAREQKERERVERIQAAIAELRAIPLRAVGKPVIVIAALMGDLEVQWDSDQSGYAEFSGEAEIAKVEARVKLVELLTAAQEHEVQLDQARRDREELVRLKSEEDKRQKEAAEREAAEIRARAEADAKRRADSAAEEAAANERIAAYKRAAQAEIDKAAKEARELQAAQDAEAKAIRDAEDKRLKAERDRLAAEARALEDRQRKEREEIEARDRAAREAQEQVDMAERKKAMDERLAAEARARREQDARDAEQREIQRKETEQFDARQMLMNFVTRFGHLPEFAKVCKAIDACLQPKKERVAA